MRIEIKIGMKVNQEILDYIEYLESSIKSKSKGYQDYIEYQDNKYYLSRYSQRYFKIDEMIFDKSGKSKGYSKADINVWTKIGREIEKLKKDSLESFLSGDIENGKRLNELSMSLSERRNNDLSLYSETGGIII